MTIAIVRTHLEILHSLLNQCPVIIRNGIAFVTSTFAIKLLFDWLEPRVGHFRYLWLRPPHWLSWLLAAFLAAAVDLAIGLPGYQSDVWDWLSFGLMPLVAVFAWKWKTWWPPSIALQIHEEAGKKSASRTLQTWLAHEHPDCPDLLEHGRIADRISCFLSEDGGTVGLHGAYGSGKSWVVQQLIKRESPELIFATVDCWGFQDSAVAVQRILAAARRSVQDRIDVTTFASLPDSYRRTFASGGDWVRSVLDLFLKPEDPLDRFRELAHILRSAKLRLVIIIEDLDRRNEGTHFQRQEVLALLEQLAKVAWEKDAGRSMSFVLVASILAGIDFSRLCDHTISITPLKPSETARLLNEARTHWLGLFPDDVLIAYQNPWTNPEHVMEFVSRVSTPSQAVAALLTTPRVMKQALRRTDRLWARLHGEIDIDHLIAIGTLQAAAPEALDFLRQYRITLSHAPSSGPLDTRAGARERMKNAWDVITNTADWRATRDAVEYLIEFLFPTARQHFTEDFSSDAERVQGLSQQAVWERYEREQAGTSLERDQTVLRELANWQAAPRDNTACVEHIAFGNEYATNWERLFERTSLPPDELLELGEAILNQYRSASGCRPEPVENDQALGHHWPVAGFAALWRLCKRINHDPQTATNWLTCQIRNSMSRSLCLVNDLYYYFGSVPSGIVRDDGYRIMCRREVIKASKDCFRSGSDLLSSLSSAQPYSLFHLIFPADNNEPVSESRGLPHWTWLGPVSIEALRLDSLIMIPQISRLVTQRSESSIFNDEPAKIDRPSMATFFGDQTDEVLAVMQHYCDQLPGNEQRLVRELLCSADG